MVDLDIVKENIQQALYSLANLDHFISKLQPALKSLPESRQEDLLFLSHKNTNLTVIEHLEKISAEVASYSDWVLSEHAIISKSFYRNHLTEEEQAEFEFILDQEQLLTEAIDSKWFLIKVEITRKSEIEREKMIKKMLDTLSNFNYDTEAQVSTHWFDFSVVAADVYDQKEALVALDNGRLVRVRRVGGVEGEWDFVGSELVLDVQEKVLDVKIDKFGRYYISLTDKGLFYKNFGKSDLKPLIKKPLLNSQNTRHLQSNQDRSLIYYRSSNTSVTVFYSLDQQSPSSKEFNVSKEVEGNVVDILPFGDNQFYVVTSLGQIALLTFDKDRFLIFWKKDSIKSVQKQQLLHESVTSAALTPDGKFLVYNDYGSGRNNLILMKRNKKAGYEQVSSFHEKGIPIKK